MLIFKIKIRSYQQRSQFILDSLRVEYDSVDITDVGNEELKDMIKEKCKHRNGQPPKTPQFFNDEIYCGVILHIHLNLLFFRLIIY